MKNQLTLIVLNKIFFDYCKIYAVALFLTAATFSQALFLVGCQPIERTARDVHVGARAFLTEAKYNHPECELFHSPPSAIKNLPPDYVGLPDNDPLIIKYGPPQTNHICLSIYKAIDANNLLVDAINIYCASPTYDLGGDCVPHADKKSMLTEALKNMQTIKKEVEGVLR